MTADFDISTKEKHIQLIYQEVLVQTRVCTYFRRIRILHMPFSSISLSHNVHSRMCIWIHPVRIVQVHPIWNGFRLRHFNIHQNPSRTLLNVYVAAVG